MALIISEAFRRTRCFAPPQFRALLTSPADDHQHSRVLFEEPYHCAAGLQSLARAAGFGGYSSCIGSVYAWSIFNPALVKVRGVVASAADDWTLSQVVWVFTVAIVFLGLAATFAGKWVENVGPREPLASWPRCAGAAA